MINEQVKRDLITREEAANFAINVANTISISKDNEAVRRRLRRRITNTLRKLTMQPTKLAKESELV
jgi:hypothetical protein